MTTYPSDIEERMRLFYESLSEKDRRRYAAIEASKLGRGGVTYIAIVLGCDASTVRRGALELAQLPLDESQGRVRKRNNQDGLT